MKITIRIVCLVIILGIATGSIGTAAEPKFGPSPWLAHDPFEEWLKTNLTDKPFYITKAEGRLHKGASEWRVQWAPAPKGVEWYWYWWYDSSGPYYVDHVKTIVGDKGLDQIWLQSFVNENGERKYQAIFLKITPHDKAKPSIPPPPAPLPVSTTPPVPKPHPIPSRSKPVQVLPGVD